MKDAAAGYLVTGRVQGVGFRWWTMRNAQRLGLRGFVRNRSDGTVEVQAAGAPEKLQQLYQLLLNGPSGAQVEQVSRTADPDGALPDPFDVR